jgi:osmotically-inducible protein OsmY
MTEATTSPEHFALQPEDREGDELEQTALITRELLEDLRLAAQVQHALWSTGNAPLRSIEVQVEAHAVTLRGYVRTYYLKQLAQSVAQAVPGAQQVRNELEVIRSA